MRKLTFVCLSLLIVMAGRADDWELIQSTDQLRAGDQIVFAYVEGGVTAAATLSSTAAKTAVWLAPVTSAFEDGVLTDIGEGTGVYTLVDASGVWKFEIEGAGGALYYLGATSAKRLSYSSDATNTWSVSVVSGEATIASTNTDYGKFCYSSSSSSARFSVYTSGNSLKSVQLFRRVVEERYALTYQGYPYSKTLCDNPTYPAGAEVRLSSGKPSKEGFKFAGWDFDGVIYQPGATLVMPEKEVTLKATWNEMTGIEDTAVRTKAVKQLRDGQLIIIRDGKEYNVLGARVK